MRAHCGRNFELTEMPRRNYSPSVSWWGASITTGPAGELLLLLLDDHQFDHVEGEEGEEREVHQLLHQLLPAGAAETSDGAEEVVLVRRVPATIVFVTFLRQVFFQVTTFFDVAGGVASRFLRTWEAAEGKA